MTMVDPVVHADNWRWRLDDGGEGSGGAGWHESENVSHTFDAGTGELDTNVRLRFSMHVTAEAIAGGGAGWQLKYSLNSGTFTTVDGISSVARSSASANFANNDDTTEHGVTFVTAGDPAVFTSDNDGMDEADGKTANKAHAINNWWAVEYCIQLREADLSDSDTVEFRVFDKDGNPIDNDPTSDALADIIIAGAGKTSTGAISILIPTLAGVGVLTGLRTSTGAISILIPTLAGVGEAGEKTSTGAISILIPTLAGVAEAGEKTSTGAISIPLLTLAGVGEAGEKTSTGAISILIPTLAGVGEAGEKTSTGAIDIPLLTLAGVGTIPDAGKTSTGAIDILIPTLAGVGVLTGLRTSTGAISILIPTLAGVAEAGEKTSTGAISILIPTLAGVGVLTGLRTSTGAISIPLLTLAGVAEAGEKTSTGAISILIPTLAGVAEAGEKTSTGAITIPLLTLAGVGEAGEKTSTGAISILIPTLAGIGEAGEKTSTGAIDIPLLTLAGLGTLGVGKTSTGAISILIPTLAGHGTKTAICDRKFMVAIDMDGNTFKGARYPIETITSTETLDGTHEFVLADATSAAFTLTLPAVASSSGKRYYVKKIDSSANAITIDGNASETIDDALTATLNTQYEAVILICDGSEWWIN